MLDSEPALYDNVVDSSDGDNDDAVPSLGFAPDDLINGRNGHGCMGESQKNKEWRPAVDGQRLTLPALRTLLRSGPRIKRGKNKTKTRSKDIVRAKDKRDPIYKKEAGRSIRSSLESEIRAECE